VSNPHPACITAAAQQTFLKTFLLFPYYSFSLNILFKKGKRMMQGHREKSKKVLAPSRVPPSAKSRDLSIPPGLDLHTPVGPELS
jgi:hypothetical protein